jgi:mono/diheme cytochrome c family protein
MRGTTFQHFSKFILSLACAAIPAMSVAADAPAKSAAKSPHSKQIERGRYLVMITGCHDCHTPNYIAKGGKVPAKDFLTGDKLGWRGSWGTTYPANLRLYFNNITDEQWIQVAKTIEARPPMPYFALNAMTRADVLSIYEYIRSLGPAGEPAPRFVPADKEPPQPYVQFPMK